MINRQQLEQAIAVQESLRGTIDDAILDATINALRAQLAALDAAAVPESRRAQATILFIDLAGHTGLIQGRDPEEIMEVIDRALEQLAEPIARYGGRIVRFQGDGYKAIFGVPAAREDDPDNAVLAALDILATAATIATELETERGMSGFGVRVGIDTGLVLIGGGTEAEDAVTGLPVNLAARLESAAKPGTILVSHHTYQHIRGVFDFQPLDPVEAKGFPQPVPVYRVLRRKARSFRTRRRGVEGVETRMVGREDELSALQTMYNHMLEQQARFLAVVVGEAGLGKSRLLYEFENWGDLQPVNVQLYRGRARLETQHLPFGLLRDVFIFRCGIFDDDEPPTVRRKLEDGFGALLGNETAEVAAHLVGHVLGYDFSASPHVRSLLSDPRQLRSQALQYLTSYFRAATTHLPLVLLLEDLHWADDSSLAVIESLAVALDNRPVLIVGAARPSLYERYPGWLGSLPRSSRIDLALLESEAAGHLVAEILKKADTVPQALRDLIVGRAEGNPFYVEELIKMLFEQGVIERAARPGIGGSRGEQMTGAALPPDLLSRAPSSDDEVWHIHMERLNEIHVPATLTGVLQARLDDLPAAERETLQQASVVGRLFWDAAVAHLAHSQSSVFEPLWTALGRRELVYPREVTSFEGTREYLFKHALLRDVTYESVLRRQRRAYHRLAAEWLIAAGGDRVDEFADLIATHYAAAGDAPDEAQWQMRAGRHAAARHALPEAERAFSRALALLSDEEATTRYDLLLAREAIYQIQGRRDAQLADLTALDALVEKISDPACSIDVALRHVTYRNVTAEYPAAIAAARAAERQAELIGDVVRQAKSHLGLGYPNRALGEYDTARTHFEAALALARQNGAIDVEAEALRALGVTAQEQGDPAAQLGYFEQALALAQSVGDQRNERRALNSLGVMLENEGRYEEARQYFEQSLALGRAIGDRTGVGTVLGNLGVTAMDTGDLAGSRTYFEEALSISRETGDTTGEYVWLLNLAFVVAVEGDTEAALGYYRQAQRGFEATGDRPSLGYVLNGIGRVLIEAGRPAEAITPLRSALALREELSQPHLATESRLLLAEALAADGELEEAQENLEAGLGVLETTGLETHEDTQRGLWAAYHVLTATGDDARAVVMLQRLIDEMQNVADRLPAESRQPYLTMHPWKQEAARLLAERGS